MQPTNETEILTRGGGADAAAPLNLDETAIEAKAIWRAGPRIEDLEKRQAALEIRRDRALAGIAASRDATDADDPSGQTKPILAERTQFFRQVVETGAYFAVQALARRRPLGHGVA